MSNCTNKLIQDMTILQNKYCLDDIDYEKCRLRLSEAALIITNSINGEVTANE